jgi:hypothetical protein
MNSRILLLCIFMHTLSAFARFQTTFEKISRANTSACTRENSDGPCIAATGHINESNDIVLCKTDPAGNGIWRRTYRGPAEEKAHPERISDGGFIIAGITQSHGQGNSDAYLLNSKIFPASGISNTGIYNFIDSVPKTGDNYYRIRVTGPGGGFFYYIFIHADLGEKSRENFIRSGK